MKVWRVTAMVVGVLWWSGCYVPVGNDPNLAATKQTFTSRAEKKSVNNQSAVVSGEDQLVIRGDVIRAEDFWRDMRDDLLPGAKNLSAADYRAQVTQLSFRWINDKMADALLYHKAAMRLTPEMEKRIDKFVDTDIRRVITAEFDGVQRKFERYLESSGSSLEEERDRRRRQVIIASYLETEIKPKIARPTRAELAAAYEANHEEWRKPSRRSMSLIDIRLTKFLKPGVTNPTREETREARQKARELVASIRREIRNGAPFAELAKKHSHGLHAVDGGSWGWVTVEGVRDRFKPAVEKLYTLSESQVSEPVETPDGFFLVRCDELDPGFDPTFEAVQPRLQERHFQSEYNRILGDLVSKLRREAGLDAAELERFHAVTIDTTIKKTLETGGRRG